MTEKAINQDERSSRRTLGVHLTSVDLFLEYIFPEIENVLEKYIWVDLYCGEGNLILPILNFIKSDERINFFKNQIFMYDIQEEMVDKCIRNATNYGIQKEIAIQNIKQRDNLKSFPDELKSKNLPIFHITNPPYLYLGYIRKHKETQVHFKYFEGRNEGFQDLYQIALMNDLRNNLNNLIYIIPSNFLFGASVSNKFRIEFLKYYDIQKMTIFETKVFKFTGTNICIVFFKKKPKPNKEDVLFKATKIKKNNLILEREYLLKSKWKYRAGIEFDEFTNNYKAKNPIEVKYYLLYSDVEENLGSCKIEVIDTNAYQSNSYRKTKLYVNEKLKEKIESNKLYVRTVDTGSLDGRVGLYEIEKDFLVDGIYVSKATYRTSPIQLFFNPTISIENQLLLKDYFNLILEYFREKIDSEFLTTYKYSSAEYTRKYLGLSQVRRIIETFPILNINNTELNEFKRLVFQKKVNAILRSIRTPEVIRNTKEKNKDKKEIQRDLSNWM